ncbi:MAG TPA: hypothetical protein VEB59_14015 [Gemmatimonadales bacterium]|nr:hypothetical protein [Gemmatimonadales bacterium]
MHRRLLGAIFAALVVVACTEDGEQSPTAPELTRHGPPTGACSYNDLKQYAKTLFGNGSPGHQLAVQMAGFSAGSAQATALGFDIFAAIAAKRNDPSVFTADNISTAAKLTVEVLDCSAASASGATSVAAFVAALGSTGAYEVRGHPTKDANVAALTADGLSGVNRPGGETFASWLTARTLFYASPISTFSTEASGGRAYDWSIVQPGATLTGIGKPALVAICIEFEDTVDELQDFRVQHQGAALGTILPLDASFLTCPATLPTVANSASIKDRLFRVFAPTPLYAAVGRRTGSPTGSAGSFSPFEAVNPTSVVPSYASSPKDARKNQVIAGTNGPVAVKVTGAGGTAWQGVTVTVFGITNNGKKVAFSGNVAVTDEAGIARFPNLSTNKTGAYRLRAETRETSPGTVSFTQATILSGKFNVRP